LVVGIGSLGNWIDQIQSFCIYFKGQYILHDIWALMTEPIIISLTFFILWILTIQKKRKVEYHLAGRLANQHTIDNLLVNSMSIGDPVRQVSYLVEPTGIEPFHNPI
jgi:hypothetical protein